MQLLGAAKYQECTDVMLVTNGRVLDEAMSVAHKLGIVIRQIPVPEGELPNWPSTAGVTDQCRWTFDRIWVEHVMPLAGQVLAGDNGTTNTVLVVDWGGLTRRHRTGSTQTIDIEPSDGQSNASWLARSSSERRSMTSTRSELPPELY